MLHHVSLGTIDLVRARAFHGRLLAVVGLRRPGANKASTTAWRFHGQPYPAGRWQPRLAWQRSARRLLRRHAGDGRHFPRVALMQDGSSDGEPGLRPHYDPNYYAAYVRDPGGNKLEAFTYAA